MADVPVVHSVTSSTGTRLPLSYRAAPDSRTARECRRAVVHRLAAFLRDELAVELSPDKTLIIHARTRAARFLGYEVIVQHDSRRIGGGRRAANAAIGLRVPRT